NSRPFRTGARHGSCPDQACYPRGGHVMRRFRLIAAALALSGAGLAGWLWIEGPAKAQAAAPPPPAIPVQAATASPADVPIQETGLGSVQAFNTVTVKVRVDGELQKI